jgi:membrane associated rhomboid family serine protease
VSGTIVAANVAAFAAELRAPDPDALVAAFAFVPYNVVHGIVLPPPSPPLAVMTLLSAMFLHASVAHIAANMLFFAALAPAVEAHFGRLPFAALYACAGVIGSLALLAATPQSHVPVIGASGAVAGIMGAYLVSFPVARPAFGLPAVVLIGAWAALQFTSGYAALTAHADPAGGTAYLAHAGGFAVGVLAAGLFKKRR